MGPAPAAGDPEKLAKILFATITRPAPKKFPVRRIRSGCLSGSQRANYTGEYWPALIDRCRMKLLQFVEQAFYLIPLGPREQGYPVLENTCIHAQRREGPRGCRRKLLERLSRW